MVYHYLKSATRLDEKGNPEEAEAAAEKAYGWYDKILKGHSRERVTDFAKSYSEKFSGSGKKALLELKENGHRLYLVSGGVQECVEPVLKENGVYGLFDGIYGNPLVTDGSGKIERLEKRTSTPNKKVSALLENDVDLHHTVVVGNGDFWDGRLFEESTHPVARSYDDGFDGLVDTIEGFEKQRETGLKKCPLPLRFSAGFARTRT